MILVTGSEGLIGKTLCAQFKTSNRKFLPFDVKNSISSDITNKQQIKASLDECQGIVHLAAVSRVILGEQQPQQCWLSNVMGTANVLQAAFEHPNKPWLIYASSREVYGQQVQFPVKESSVLKPINTYAYSKFLAESLVNSYRERGLRTQIIRFSSVYGRTDDYVDRVIPAFCRNAILGLPLRLEGGENQFDFTHVSDAVDGLMKAIAAIEAKCQLPAAIHFTTGVPTTILQAASLARSYSKNNSNFIEAPPRNYDVAKFYGDPALAEQTLGWRAVIDIQQGIKKLIADFELELIQSSDHCNEYS